MTIINETNIISTTIGELQELMRIVHIHHGDAAGTIINIEVDSNGDCYVTSQPALTEKEIKSDGTESE